MPSTGTISPQFWQGKHVFLTGHTGFKGAWLLMLLKQLGARVTGYALAPEKDSALFSAGKLEALCETHYCADIRDAKQLAEAMQQTRPDIVIHMAAQALVLASYHDPVETFQTNVMGTIHVLEAVRKTDSVKAVINVTSDKCYENRHDLPQNARAIAFAESHPLGGDDPYSASKACAEIVGHAWQHSFLQDSPVAFASARSGNVIGGGDYADNRLVPDILHALATGEDITLRMPKSVRPWQHVLNPLHGYLVLAQALCENRAAFEGAWNFGPDAEDAIPVDALTEALLHRWKNYTGTVNTVKATYSEAPLLMLDITKSHECLHWQPTWNLAKGLDDITRFHQLLTPECDVQALMTETIQTFMADADQ